MTSRLYFIALVLLLASVQTSAAEHTLKIATVSPEGTYWMQQMRQGASEIKKRTEGRVELKFYGGGVMGNDKKVLRKIRIGQLHGGAFPASGLAERYPDINLYGLPLVFESLDEVDYVRQQLDQELIDGLADEIKYLLLTFGQVFSILSERMSDKQ